MTSPSLLVVDDDRGNCEIVARVLGTSGYHVDVAYDGAQALELARRNEYDLAVLDYQMPGMNGVELFERIHNLQPHVVGIFLTAYTRIDTVYPAIHAGVHSILPKPVDFKELLGLLEEVVGKPA